MQRIDVHGLSLAGDTHAKNHDHFAIATLNKSMRVHQSSLSIDDDSRVHGHNQGHLFLVADGVSSAPSPARASGTAIDSIVQYFLNEMPWYHIADGEPADVILALEDALRNAQDELLHDAAADKAGMGTTLTLAFVFWPNLYVAHVGDSRCYLMRDETLRQLTTDHTEASLLRKVGRRAPSRSEHVLWNAVGGGGVAIHPEVRHVELAPNDVLALVTDGVSHATSRDEIAGILDRDASAEQVCGRLVDRPGSDDRTAIVVRFLPKEERPAANEEPSAPPELAARHPAPPRGPGHRSAPPGRRAPRRPPTPRKAAS